MGSWRALYFRPLKTIAAEFLGVALKTLDYCLELEVKYLL
jgi:hypothetical protein